MCKSALSYVLHHADYQEKLPAHCKFKVSETLCRVTVYHKMLPYCKNTTEDDEVATWRDVLECTQRTDPVGIVQSLVEADKYELCLEWLEYQAFSSSLVTPDLLMGLLNHNQEAEYRSARKVCCVFIYPQGSQWFST